MPEDTTERLKPAKTFDSAYGFSFSIAVGLILFIAGLVISLTLSDGTKIGLIFGIPLLIAGLVSLQAGAATQQAVEFERKLLQIAEHGHTTGRPAPKRTSISESEVNAWFTVRAGDLLPEGVAAPSLRMSGSNRVTGTAVIDLDQQRRYRAGFGFFRDRRPESYGPLTEAR